MHKGSEGSTEKILLPLLPLAALRVSPRFDNPALLNYQGHPHGPQRSLFSDRSYSYSSEPSLSRTN